MFEVTELSQRNRDTQAHSQPTESDAGGWPSMALKVRFCQLLE